jgi:uncharacterized membrane protein YkvA (DUF1232 family)
MAPSEEKPAPDAEVRSGEILGPEVPDPAAEQRVRRGFWATFKRAARSVPFIDEVVAGYYCALDKETPARVRAMLIGALAYFVLPLDTIPDFIAGLGFTDDATILLATLAMVRSHIKPKHREAAKRALADGDEQPNR